MSEELIQKLAFAEIASLKKWIVELKERNAELEEALLKIANLEADPEFGTPPLETAKAIARKAL